MKHSHGFCFTSVIAYNSMKLQPELISLAADQGSCQVWWSAITWGDWEEGGCSPQTRRHQEQLPLQGIPVGWGLVPRTMAPLAAAGFELAVMGMEGWSERIRQDVQKG